MGLYMNDNEHPTLFKNNGPLIHNNQAEYRSDYLSDLIKDQQTSNRLVQRTIQALKTTQTRSNQRQILKLTTLKNQLNELKELHTQHHRIEKQVMDWLEKLEVQNEELHATITDEQLDIKNLTNQVLTIGQLQTDFELKLKKIAGSNNEIVNQLTQQNVLNDEISERLDQYTAVNDAFIQRLDVSDKKNDEVVIQLGKIETKTDKLIEKIDSQHTLQQTTANQLENLEVTHHKLAKHVDSQEGLLEKVIHQIDHLRSVLYERSNFLNEKIEKAYEYFKVYSKN
jgi:chromosome segregation ATPase